MSFSWSEKSVTRFLSRGVEEAVSSDYLRKLGMVLIISWIDSDFCSNEIAWSDLDGYSIVPLLESYWTSYLLEGA